MHVRDIHALTVGKGAARNHRAGDIRFTHTYHCHFNAAVIDQHAVADLELGGQVGIGDGNLPIITLHRAGGKGEHVPLVKSNGAVLEGADTDFRPFGIQHDGGGLTKLVANAAEGLNDLLMRLVVAMRKIKASHIHASLHHFGHDLLRARSGADGTNDLCF